MNGENPSSGDGGRFNTGWEGLGEATPSSAIKNTAERTATNFNKFIEGWRAARAQKAQAASVNKVNKLATEEEDKLSKMWDTYSDFDKADRSRSDADTQLDFAQAALQTKKDTLSDLRSEYNVGEYVHDQTKQIGFILKAEGNVVKSALGAFAAKFITKLPHIEISVRTTESIANRNGREQIYEQSLERSDARKKMQEARKAYRDFEKDKADRNREISGLSANRNKWQSNRESIAETRKELADAKMELVDAKKRKREADERLSNAREVFTEAHVHYASCKNELEEAKAAQQAQAEKLAKSQERLETLNAIAELQNKLGNKSPNSIRKDIEGRISAVQDIIDDKLEDILFAEKVDSIEELSDDERKRVEKRLQKYTSEISRLEAERDELDRYEELRRGKVETVAANPVAKKSIINVFKRAIQSSLAAVIR